MIIKFLKALGRYQAGLATVLAFAALICFSAAPRAQMLDYRDYVPIGQFAGGNIVSAGGVRVNQWAMSPQGSGVSDLYWYEPWKPAPYYFERQSVRLNPATNSEWVYIDGYCKDGFGCDPIAMYKVLVTFGGQTFDITRVSVPGQPYAPVKFEGPYEVKAWGFINGSTKFFWHARVTQESAVVNPFWQGDTKTARDTIRQNEIWWDSASGWELGSTGPIGADGWPTGEHPQWSRNAWIAKDIGWWMLHWPIVNWTAGTQFRWSWAPKVAAKFEDKFAAGPCMTGMTTGETPLVFKPTNPPCALPHYVFTPAAVQPTTGADLRGTNSALALNGVLELHGGNIWGTRSFEGNILVTAEAAPRAQPVAVSVDVDVSVIGSAPNTWDGGYFGLTLYNGEDDYRALGVYHDRDGVRLVRLLNRKGEEALGRIPAGKVNLAVLYSGNADGRTEYRLNNAVVHVDEKPGRMQSDPHLAFVVASTGTESGALQYTRALLTNLQVN